MTIKKIFTNIRILIFLFALVAALFAINYQFGVYGASIKMVEKNSSAYEAGIQPPSPETRPTNRERIIEINSQKISNIQDYNSAIKAIKLNGPVKIKTNKQDYAFLKDKEDLGLVVSNVPTSNLRKGLELQGGTRVLLQPEGQVTDQEITDVIATMENRLNVYGLTDLTIRPASDFLGNKFIIVEVAGASKEEVKDLIAKQGKFEAKIDQEIIFRGGEKDITFVCRTDGTCSRIIDCLPTQDKNYACKFEFEISITSEAAQKQAEATKNLNVNVTETGNRVLEKTIDFYLDDKLVDSLQISAELKGKPTTQILITGPGFGKNQQEAVIDAIKNRDKLQTILITGSLPTKLEITKLDSISPVLGEAFLKNSFMAGLVAILTVAIIIFIRYRSLKTTLPMIFIVISEVYLTIGMAALLGYSIDLAAIAGIIASVGTGVDDQIIINDEIRSKEYLRWKEKIKKAFFIIFSAFAATVAAMLPLLKAGAGLLTGFAFVTIIGVSIGVLITRPAYAAFIQILYGE